MTNKLNYIETDSIKLEGDRSVDFSALELNSPIGIKEENSIYKATIYKENTTFVGILKSVVVIGTFTEVYVSPIKVGSVYSVRCMGSVTLGGTLSPNYNGSFNESENGILKVLDFDKSKNIATCVGVVSSNDNVVENIIYNNSTKELITTRSSPLPQIKTDLSELAYEGFQYQDNESVNTGSKWVDGKDIYIATFTNPPFTISGDKKMINITELVPDVDTVLDYKLEISSNPNINTSYTTFNFMMSPGPIYTVLFKYNDTLSIAIRGGALNVLYRNMQITHTKV